MISLRCGGFAAQHSLDARDRLTNYVHTVGLFDLARSGLESQIKLLLFELQKLFMELVSRKAPDVSDLH